METSRRSVIPGALALGALTLVPASAVARADRFVTDDAREAADAYAQLSRWRDLRAGGADDIACGDWMEAHLRAHGYRIGRQAFQTPYFEPSRAELRVGNAALQVIPQAVVTPTGPDGVSGPLRLWRDAADSGAMAGAVALLMLPHGRHSQLAAQPILSRVRQVAAAGAVAIVMVTVGPTGEPLALNADPDGPPVPLPMAVIGPRVAQSALAAASEGTRATLVLTGQGGRRQAFNLTGAIDRPGPRLVISTPRSGWGPCMGERGPGIAAFRILTAWAPRAFGMFGAHRFHHAPNDDIEKVDPAFIPPVTAALRQAITALLPG